MRPASRWSIAVAVTPGIGGAAQCEYCSARRTSALVDTVSVPDTDIVINATSIGLHPKLDQRLDLDPDSPWRAWSWRTAFTTRPAPISSVMLARGCRVLDGLGMLVNQGCDRHQVLDRHRRRPSCDAPHAGGNFQS